MRKKLLKTIAATLLATQLLQSFPVSYAIGDQEHLKQQISQSIPEYEADGQQAKERTPGLWGYYFKNRDFVHTIMVAPSNETGLFTDSSSLVDFPGLANESFQSARWIGYVKAPETGSYTFSTSDETNSMIQVNGTTLQAGTSGQSSIQLEKDTFYNIVIEYQAPSQRTVERDELTLFWQIDEKERTNVPQIHLYTPYLSAEEGDERYLEAYPAESLFGTRAIDEDSDKDKISDTLEKNGYTVDADTHKIVEWKDEYESKGWPKYTSNPFSSHTVGDPYMDSVKALGQMPSTDSVARHPMVAAFPAVGVTMENIIISKNEDYSHSEDHTTSSSKSNAITGGGNIQVGVSTEGISGSVSGNFSYTHTTSSTVTDSTGSNVHLNTAETAYVNANIRYYNNGNSSIYDVVPTTSFVIGDTTIATVTAQANEIGNVLGAGAHYPDLSQHAIALNTLDQFSSRPIPINYQQFQAIDGNHHPILLETNQVAGTLGEYDFDGNIITVESWVPYIESIENRAATLIIDDGEEQIEQRIAGRNLDDTYDSTPEITVKDALKASFGVTEDATTGALTYKGRSISETDVTLVYDQATLDKIENQLANVAEKNVYNIKLEPEMKLLVILPDLMDGAEDGGTWFDRGDFYQTTGGLNDSGSYLSIAGKGLLRFKDSSRQALDMNSRYILSAYVKTNNSNYEDFNFALYDNFGYPISFKTFRVNNQWTKIEVPVDIHETNDLAFIWFGAGRPIKNDVKLSDFRVDNVSFSKLGGETYGENLISNSDFQSGTGPWDFSNAAGTILANNGPLGENSLMYVASGGHLSSMQKSFPVKQNTNYLYSFDIYALTDSNYYEAYINGGTNTSVHKNLGYIENQKWKNVSIYFNSETGSSFQVGVTTLQGPISEFLITNVKLREVDPKETSTN